MSATRITFNGFEGAHRSLSVGGGDDGGFDSLESYSTNVDGLARAFYSQTITDGSFGTGRRREEGERIGMLLSS